MNWHNSLHLFLPVHILHKKIVHGGSRPAIFILHRCQCILLNLRDAQYLWVAIRILSHMYCNRSVCYRIQPYIISASCRIGFAAVPHMSTYALEQFRVLPHVYYCNSAYCRICLHGNSAYCRICIVVIPHTVAFFILQI